MNGADEEKKLTTVLTPFEKGLNHFVKAGGRKELFHDVITDMYEALEALACEVTQRHKKDLSENKELLLSKVALDPAYRNLLTAFIDFAQNFRHSRTGPTKKPDISQREAESYIYPTGVFIRAVVSND